MRREITGSIPPEIDDAVLAIKAFASIHFKNAGVTIEAGDTCSIAVVHGKHARAFKELCEQLFLTVSKK